MPLTKPASLTPQTVRQHALSTLTDSFLENQVGLIPIAQLCQALGQLCIPLAGRRIAELRASGDAADSHEEVMAELELCIGLVFKPLRHHIQNIVNEGTEDLMLVWVPILDVMKEVFNESISENGTHENGQGAAGIIKSSNELALEYLRNIITVLIDYNVLQAEPSQRDDMTALTWDAVAEMNYCKDFLEEWKQAAGQ